MIDKKKAVLSILAMKPKKEAGAPTAPKEEEMEEEAEEEVSMDLEAAADDVLAAFESKDPAGLAKALKAFMGLC